MLADERKREGHYKTVFTGAMQRLIREKLGEHQWSPEQIHGWCGTQGIDMVSHERIYQFIWQDRADGGQLYRNLRHGSRKYRKRYGSYQKRGGIPNRVSIDERPDQANDRARIGDWEMDLIVGAAHKGALLTIVERKTGFTLIADTQGKKAKLVARQAINTLAPFKEHVHTITNDNGKEFAMHEHVAEKLQAKVFFAHPYASWERGLNEYTNKLIRQYLPKHTDLRHITAEQIAEIEHKLNNRPRKTLGYRTPLQELMNNFDP
jgi:IS30 family transposase